MIAIERSMMGRTISCAAIAVLCLSAGCVHAERAHRRASYASADTAVSSRDAAELAALAPPARRSTVEQAYGDASYAREHFRGLGWRPCMGADFVWGASNGVRPCTTRITEDLVGRRPESGYAFTPAYLAAPQILTAPPDAETRLLPEAALLPWIVDDAAHRH